MAFNLKIPGDVHAQKAVVSCHLTQRGCYLTVSNALLFCAHASNDAAWQLVGRFAIALMKVCEFIR